MPVGGGRTPRVPRMVRGSVITHRRRCGKPNCRCASGTQMHETTVLSYSEGGRTRFLMLPAEEVPAVRAATERFRRAKAELQGKADAGLAELVARLRGSRRQAR